MHYYSDEKNKTCNVIKLAQSHFVRQTDPGSKPSRTELSIQALKLLTRKIFYMPWLRCFGEWKPMKEHLSAWVACSVIEAEHPERTNSILTKYQQICISNERFEQAGI